MTTIRVGPSSKREKRRRRRKKVRNGVKNGARGPPASPTNP